MPSRNPTAIRDGLYPCECGRIAIHQAGHDYPEFCERCYRIYLEQRHQDIAEKKKDWSKPQGDGFDFGPDYRGNDKQEEWMEIRKMRVRFVEGVRL